MADVALSGVERRDKSTESPAKYAGNEDGEKSDDEHRGEIHGRCAIALLSRGDRPFLIVIERFKS